MIQKSDNNCAQVFSNIEEFDPTILHQKIVFTNGCFDILHKGHVKCLVAAKALGDLLIVGLNSDSSIKLLKGPQRPINKWADRAAVLSHLRCVDIIIGFDEETPINLIKAIRPDVICKGGDYAPSEMIGKEFVESYGGEVKIIPFQEGYSTSKTIKLMSEL